MHARKYTDADAARILDVNKVTQVVAVEPVAVKRRTAAAMLQCGETMIFHLCKGGHLDTIMVGKERRITIASIRAFVARGGCVARSGGEREADTPKSSGLRGRSRGSTG